MRDKDAILLEEMYNLVDRVVLEMGANKHYTKKLTKDRKTRTSRAKTSEDQEERIIENQKEISKLLKNIESNPDDLESASEIIRLLIDSDKTKFGEFDEPYEDEDDASSMAISGFPKRTEFVIDGTEEMTEEEILQKVLDSTRTIFHDYKKLLSSEDGKTKGIKVDTFMKERIPKTDPDTGEVMKDANDQVIYHSKSPEQIEHIRKFYHLYEIILSKLQSKVTPRSRREKPGHNEDIFYFDKDNDPIKTFIRVPSNGIVPSAFGNKNRFLGKIAPPIREYGVYNPEQLRGKSIEDIKELVKHDEAKREFEKRYPQTRIDDYGNEVPTEFSFLYTGGQPPRGFLQRYWEKKDAEKNAGSLEQESYKTFLEQWNRDNVDDFENESEEDLYSDEDEDEEGCSCGGEAEDCSCEEEDFQE